MHQYPFDPATGRRRTVDEAVRWAEQTYGCVIVNGIDQLLESRGAAHNSQRVTSYIDAYEAWYLNQSSTENLLRWRSFPVPEGNSPYVVFLLSVGLGNGSALPQPTGRFDLAVNGERVASLRVVKHSEIWETGDVRVCYDVRRLETAKPGQALILDTVLREESFASFGVLLVRVPRTRLTAGQPVEFALQAYNRVPSTQWMQVTNGTNARIHSNFYPALARLAAGRVAPKLGDQNVYFGDIHNHSGESLDGYGVCGMGTVAENYEYARNVANLDFYALTEHDWQMGPAHWEMIMQKVEASNEPGRFATIPAFEWTSLAYGHRNVYYADANQPFFLAWQEAKAGSRQREAMGPELDTPNDLWRKLEGLNTMVMTAPHHPPAASHPLNWSFFNPKYDRFVEIYSSWGSSEFPENRFKGCGCDHHHHLYVSSALNAGLRFGLVASSDGHDGNPGNAQSPQVKHPHLYHYLGSGRTAVLAPDLSRESVLQALYDRRCYAVTGEPILLDFQLSGHLMGRELTVSQAGRKPLLTADVTGTTHLKRLEIIKNGRVVWRQECCGENFNRESVAWVDEALDTRRDNYYYFKVTQRDGEMAWSSPIWVGRD